VTQIRRAREPNRENAWEMLLSGTGALTPDIGIYLGGILAPPTDDTARISLVCSPNARERRSVRMGRVWGGPSRAADSFLFADHRTVACHRSTPSQWSY
jgi:hypothetical protein